MPTVQTTIQCIQCRQPFRATVQSLIDPDQNPQAKISLLSGNINASPCPHCGTVNTIMTPLLYHDASKELLISYVPMELGLSKDAQEKAIGDMMREVTGNLPQGAFKAYLLQPRQALTTQGLIEQVLQADGVTPQMMQEQRDRVKLIEVFVQAPPEAIPGLVQQHDDRIDAQFIQTMTLLIQQFLNEGREQVAEQVAAVQNLIVELSTFGRQLIHESQEQEAVVAEVANQINALGPNAQRSDFLNLTVSYAGDVQRLQALVGLVRPVFDYQFFQELTDFTSKSPADDRGNLEELRDTLLQLTSMVDQQAQAAMQEAVQLLRAIMGSPQPDELIQANLPMIDYTFMQILSANIQEATQRGDINASARLKDIYQRVVAALQANMPPELRFINELLNTPEESEAIRLIIDRAGEFGDSLLGALDAVEQQLLAQGNPRLLQRFDVIRRELTQQLSS
ncbi:MAG: CpXC domain-containing protein [Anaerolineae bacterium]|nr:CpXC domain-containing protein [Anaerolineae bacterium]